jgi:hypothetical protein
MNIKWLQHIAHFTQNDKKPMLPAQLFSFSCHQHLHVQQNQDWENNDAMDTRIMMGRDILRVSAKKLSP